MYSIRLELGKEAEDRRFERKKREAEARRIQEEKEHRKRVWYIRRFSVFGVVFLIFIVALVLIVVNVNSAKRAKEEEKAEETVISEELTMAQVTPVVDTSYLEEQEQLKAEEEARKALMYTATDAGVMVELGADVLSEYAIVLDTDANEIVSTRKGRARINPASMTKVLTLLVAAEHIEADKLDDKFTITPEITYYSYKHDCSAVGFLDEEEVTVRDMLYGTILPSGADAALGLATYVAGSQEAFVDMMNDKLEELGISDTAHFTNCIGLYDEDHYCTCYDMAMILHAAIDNELCREVLSAKIYTTSATEQHPDGIEISNWFLRRIEDKDSGGEVLCAKTGFVSQSGNCAASYALDADGNNYIVVTGNAPSSWKCIYDHVRIYRQLFPAYNGSYVNDNAAGTDETTEEEADTEEVND